MEYLSTGKILIIDLAGSQVEEEELEESLVSEKIGGAGITKYLYEKFESDDPLVIGCGLLTGTTYPASASGVITAKSPVTGNIAHCPIIFKVGVEIKFSGFDYIVIKGTAVNPSYLWIHDGVADICDAAAIWGKDVWEATESLRELVGDDLLQTMMIGPAGEKQSDYAQICYNHWNSPDRFGFGKVLGAKNLKGIAFRGMGLIEAEEIEDFVSRSLEILQEVKENEFLSKKGIAELSTAIGEEDLTAWLAPITHRHSADYFTPYATITSLFVDEDPKIVEETKVAAPGVLAADLYALIALKKAGFSAEDAGHLLMETAKYGIDPLAVIELSGKTSLADCTASFDSLSGSLALNGKGIFSSWCPARPIFNDFGLSGGTDEAVAWWERRQAVASVFGIQPLFADMCPELSEENMLELASLGTDIDLDQDILDGVVTYVCD